MTYVLVVLTWIGGSYTDGGGVAMQEFSSQTACEQAKAEVMSQATTWRMERRFRPFAVWRNRRPL